MLRHKRFHMAAMAIEGALPFCGAIHWADAVAAPEWLGRIPEHVNWMAWEVPAIKIKT